MKTSFHFRRTTLGAALLVMLGTAKLASLPSAALAMAVQAAPWLGLGASLVARGEALAATKQIPGIGIRVKKSPGGTARTTPVQSDPDGSFNFTGLAPGDYEVTPDGGKSVLLKVGADGKLSGVMQEDGSVRSVVKPKPGAPNTDYSYVPQKAGGSHEAARNLASHT